MIQFYLPRRSPTGANDEFRICAALRPYVSTNGPKRAEPINFNGVDELILAEHNKSKLQMKVVIRIRK